MLRSGVPLRSSKQHLRFFTFSSCLSSASLQRGAQCCFCPSPGCPLAALALAVEPGGEPAAVFL